MKKSILAAAFALSFAMVACDSSSSASADDTNPQSSGNESTLSSDANSATLSSATEVPSSSNDAEKTVSSSSQGNEFFTDNSSSSGKKNSDAGNELTSDQRAMLKAIADEAIRADGNVSQNDDECVNKDVRSEVIWGQEVVFTCVYGGWVPTSGLDKVVEAYPPELLETLLANTGITKQELLDLINMMSRMNTSNDNLQVACDGEVNGNSWLVKGSGVMMGYNTTFVEKISFDGSTMTTTREMKMDVTEATACRMIAADSDEDEDEDEYDEDMGKAISSDTHCDGSVFVQTETLVRKNMTAEARAEIYDATVGACKDFRDGKISFEEMMSE